MGNGPRGKNTGTRKSGKSGEYRVLNSIKIVPAAEKAMPPEIAARAARLFPFMNPENAAKMYATDPDGFVNFMDKMETVGAPRSATQVPTAPAPVSTAPMTSAPTSVPTPAYPSTSTYPVPVGATSPVPFGSTPPATPMPQSSAAMGRRVTATMTAMGSSMTRTARWMGANLTKVATNPWLRYQTVGSINWLIGTQIDVINSMFGMAFPWLEARFPKIAIPNRPPMTQAVNKRTLAPMFDKMGNPVMVQMTSPAWARTTAQLGRFNARLVGGLLSATFKTVGAAKRVAYR